MKGIWGRKIGMTNLFTETGEIVPVTVIKAGPCQVVQVKTKGKNGYDALQVGMEEVPERKVNKPLRGHFVSKGVKTFKILREIRLKKVEGEGKKVGDWIKVDIFQKGEKVDVTGVSKGKGFMGAVKRWHFHGGPASHGSMQHRKPASGGATAPARTFKGKRGPGRMGNERVTVIGLEVIDVLAEQDILVVKGAIPGAANSLIFIRESIKK